MRTGDQNIFSFYLPTRIVHGQHSIQDTGKEFKALGATKALIVTDRGVKGAGLLEGLFESLKKSALPYAVFDEVEEDPGAATIAKGADLASKEKCDGIIVLGGGSPLCAGRAIAVIVTNGGNIKDYAGFNRVSKMPLPLIAIPTTAGSGAEVSQFIILKNEERHTKMVVGSALCFPKLAILDPMLLRGLSCWQFVVSGVDALTHAIDSYLTTTTTPITDALALAATRLIFSNLRTAATSDDLDAKEACLIGSTMSNMALGNARFGLVHSMTVPMEGMFKIQHGIAVGILLPYVLEYNLPASFERFSILAKTMGEPDGKPMPDLAFSAILAIKKLFMDLGFPRKYSEPQVDRKAIPEMSRMIVGPPGTYDPKKEYPLNSAVSTFNIRKATLKDVINLFERSFEGWEL